MLNERLKMALYGTLQTSLLFWRLFSDTLLDWGFKQNEYDKCVTNKTINGWQFTIIWRVDNLKISNVDKKFKEYIITKLTERKSPLTTTCSKVLVYLRMTLENMTKGKIIISMYE